MKAKINGRGQLRDPARKARRGSPSAIRSPAACACGTRSSPRSRTASASCSTTPAATAAARRRRRCSTLDMLAEDLRQLLAELKIRRTHYCGLSMGGMIGQVVLTDPGVTAWCSPTTGHAQTPETRKQWEERIKTAETRGMQPLRNPRSSAGSPRISGQAGRGHHPQADRLDAGTRLRRLLPRYLEPEYTARLKEISTRCSRSPASRTRPRRERATSARTCRGRSWW